MKEIKKYTDVVRYGKSSTEDVLNKGDYISITEKIDGANASFRIDDENSLGVSCYSSIFYFKRSSRKGYINSIINESHKWC